MASRLPIEERELRRNLPLPMHPSLTDADETPQRRGARVAHTVSLNQGR